MSRTYRRGWTWDENLEVHETKGKTLPDRCNNPHCRGSVDWKSKVRRRERYRLRDDLRNKPEEQHYLPDKQNKW